ncbi:MAG: radical SAM protein [Candidatus Aminicenantes bacterium]|nr:radical SAM protein [Candidatus Aminicenantes bacterium]
MPQQHILKITEIFPSIQGEGLRQGEATIFIRLSGCNLKCSFCDTKYAWEEGQQYSVAQVLDEVRKIRKGFPARWICFTGGEPLLHDIGGLTKSLKKEGLKIQVETNATLYRTLPVDWYSISPKPESYDYRPEYRERAKEVKIIVTKNLDLESIRRLRMRFPEKTPILLQPQSNRKWSMALGIKLLRQALKAGLRNISLSVQLHKIYGLR